MTDRRSFLRGASVLMGHAAFGQVMTAFAAAPRKATFFTDPEMRTLRALVDVILPATDSPAASAADTHYFIDLAMPACASAAAQKTFRAGLAALRQKRFASLAPAEQVALLKARAAAGHGAALRPVVLQDSQGLHAHRILPLRDRRHAGAGVRKSPRRLPGRPAARAPTRKRGRSDGHLKPVRRDRRRLRHVGRLGRERAHGEGPQDAGAGARPQHPPRHRLHHRAQGSVAAAAQQSRHQRRSRRAAHPVDALSIRPVDQAALRQRPAASLRAGAAVQLVSRLPGRRTLAACGRATCSATAISISKPTSARAWASTGRSATRTSRPGTNTSSDSSARAARTPACRNCRSRSCSRRSK